MSADRMPISRGISFLHRFGSALNHHVHLHVCVTDGVFVPAAAASAGDGHGSEGTHVGKLELGRGLRRRQKNAAEAGAGRFEKSAPDARAAPPEAHESLISPKTGAEVPLTGLSFLSLPPSGPLAK